MQVVHMGGCFACTEANMDSGGDEYFGVRAPAHSSYHILEAPGGIDRMREVEIPTEEYYSALRKYMVRKYMGDKHPKACTYLKHPKACTYLLEHLLELEAMFDVCVVSGFSMGIPKVILAATSGPMLGDNVGRHGRTPNGERVQEIWEFATVKNLKQMQQFLGCCIW